MLSYPNNLKHSYKSRYKIYKTNNTFDFWRFIFNDENIDACINQVCKKKSKSKKQRIFRNQILQDIPKYRSRIKNILANNCFSPVYKNIILREGKKQRSVDVSRIFPDRVIFLLIHKALTPQITKRLSPYSFAGVKDRGLHQCVKNMSKTIKKLKKNNCPVFCLSLDLKKFFYNIDNNILFIKIINTLKPDINTIKLLQKVIFKFKGLPLGSSLSQNLSNLYLSDVDAIFSNVKGYFFRYCDNIFIFNKSKSFLKSLINSIKNIIRNLKLDFSFFELIRLKNTTCIRCLGVLFYKDITLLQKSITKKINYKIHFNNFSDIAFIKN